MRLLVASSVTHQPEEEHDRDRSEAEASPIEKEIERDAGQAREVYLREVADAVRETEGLAARIVVFEGSIVSGAGPVSAGGPAGAVPPLMPTDQM